MVSWVFAVIGTVCCSVAWYWSGYWAGRASLGREWLEEHEKMMNSLRDAIKTTARPAVNTNYDEREAQRAALARNTINRIRRHCVGEWD